MPTVKKAMTPHLISVSCDMPVVEAEALMIEKRIRHLPVMDHEGTIVGLLSERDLIPLQRNTELTVAHLMSSPAQFVHMETPLRTAIFKMLEKKISCLLISDDDDEAVGIITTDDLLWYLTHLLAEEADQDVSLGSAFDLQTASRVTQTIADAGI